ncbi:MAG: hypothetical protein Q8N38_09450 [Bacteroidales bacterium]|nr:hypothetical protein [Bacteroidales bacterium]
MKRIIFFTIFLICFVQLLPAQQKKEVEISSSFKMLTNHTWLKTHEELGAFQLEFKKDSTYTVTMKSNELISGTFSLIGNTLTFVTDSRCQKNALYTITVTEETVNFIKKEDQCEGRNEIVPGIWKALKQ